MKDTIYRQDAIDALDKEYRCTDRSDDWDGLKTAMLIVENLPSVQSNLQPTCNKLATDTISRKEAIDAINTWNKFGVDERGRLVRWHEGLELYVHLRDVLTAIVNLPSAQPKRLIWEQKIKKASIHRYGNDVCCTILDHALNRTFGYKFCPMCGERLFLKIEKQKGERNEAD